MPWVAATARARTRDGRSGTEPGRYVRTRRDRDDLVLAGPEAGRCHLSEASPTHYQLGDTLVAEPPVGERLAGTAGLVNGAELAAVSAGAAVGAWSGQDSEATVAVPDEVTRGHARLELNLGEGPSKVAHTRGRSVSVPDMAAPSVTLGPVGPPRQEP